MSTAAQPHNTAAMPHATANPSPSPRPLPAADAARRPAPIQTANLYTTHLPQAHPVPSGQTEAVLERPPISPITPTDEDGPASLPAYPHTQTPATHSQDDPNESRPLSRTSFTFTAPQHASTPPRPLSQRSGSQSARPNGSSDANGATPPRPPSSTSQQPFHFSSGVSGSGAHAAQPQASRVPPSAIIPPATFMPQPPSQPLDDASNTDVAALKACISVLQLQQAKSRKDIAALQRLKDGASADPAGFAVALQSGRLNDEAAAADPLAATFAGADDDESDDEQMADADADAEARSAHGKFGTIPRPQNVVRCPPINWAKYHVVGESLDRMHEDQRRRPDPGEPWREGPREAVVFAPYSPFRDQLGPQQQGMVTRKGGKRPG